MLNRRALWLSLAALVALSRAGCRGRALNNRATAADSGVVTVESLLARVAAVPAGARSFELLVTEELTLRGRPVPPDLAKSLIVDAMFERGLFPAGFERRGSARLYRFSATQAAPSAE
jgi:hypothetical protein